MKHITDELLINYLLGECTTQDQELVDQWLKETEANRVYFEQFSSVWNESKALAFQSAINEDEAWQRMKVRMQQPKTGLRIYRSIFYLAAAVLLIAGIIYLFQYISQGNFSKAPAPVVIQQQSIQTDTIPLVDTLSDKSVVTLNKHSQLSYPSSFSSHERRVRLRGEAFFSITPDQTKPFFIDATNDVEIRVVGTSFNVKAYEAYTEVVVESGIVEIRKFNRVMLLHPKEKARIGKEDSTIVVEKIRDRLYKYYRSKEFECDNTPLWKVVEVLNEAYEDSVVIAREDLKGLTLTTRFDNESLSTILDIISETFDIKVEKQGNIYFLK